MSNEKPLYARRGADTMETQEQAADAFMREARHASSCADRLAIVTNEARPLDPDKKTFFSLPGELRNEVYRLAFAKDYQCVPLNAVYLNKPEAHIIRWSTSKRAATWLKCRPLTSQSWPT
jgi:hypothetical protein